MQSIQKDFHLQDEKHKTKNKTVRKVSTFPSQALLFEMIILRCATHAKIKFEMQLIQKRVTFTYRD